MTSDGHPAMRRTVLRAGIVIGTLATVRLLLTPDDAPLAPAPVRQAGTRRPTGGTTEPPRPHLFGWVDFQSDKSYYVLVVVIASVFLLFMWNFSRSRAARACFAVRDNENGAAAMGINVAKYKLMAFALHGFIAGTAGALYAHWAQNVSAGGQRPAFGLEVSLAIVFLTILGGVSEEREGCRSHVVGDVAQVPLAAGPEFWEVRGDFARVVVFACVQVREFDGDGRGEFARGRL